MKTTLKLNFILCFMSLMIVSSMYTFAAKGPELLLNRDFALLDTMPSADTTYVFPRNWVYDANPIYQGGNLVFKWWEKQEDYGIARSWTGEAGKGVMYQEVTGLADGTYEFSMQAYGMGTGTAFAKGFGGDSVGIAFGNSTGQIYRTGLIEVTSGKCIVGVYILNTLSSYFDLYNFSFKQIIPVPGLNKLNLTQYNSGAVLPFAAGSETKWVYEGPQSDKALFTFKDYIYNGDPNVYHALETWTGTVIAGSAVQEVTGLANGIYEFSFTISGAQTTGAAFATSFGGDSIGVPFTVPATQTLYSTGPINVTNGKCKVGIYINNSSDGSWAGIYNLKFNLVTVENSITLISAPKNISTSGVNSLSLSYVAEQDGYIWAGLFDKDWAFITGSANYAVVENGSGVAKIDISTAGLIAGEEFHWYAALRDTDDNKIFDISQIVNVITDSIMITKSEVAKNGDIKFSVFYSGLNVDSIKTFLFKADWSKKYGELHKAKVNISGNMSFAITPSETLPGAQYVISADLFYKGNKLKNHQQVFITGYKDSINVTMSEILSNGDIKYKVYYSGNVADSIETTLWVKDNWTKLYAKAIKNVTNGTSTVTFTVTPSETLKAANYTISADLFGGGKKLTNYMHYFTVTGINSIANNTFGMFPNPLNANGVLTIESPQNGIVSISVLDILGQVVAVKSFSSSISISASELNLGTGVYFVKMNQSVSKLVVK